MSAPKTHGRTHTVEYATWERIVQRCGNPNATNWCRYGARGIRVCARWRESFEAFLADMGERPRGASPDRIDATKGYEPGNCRWADERTQRLNNRRVSLNGLSAILIRGLTIRGVPKKALTVAFGVSRATVEDIVSRRTWKTALSDLSIVVDRGEP